MTAAAVAYGLRTVSVDGCHTYGERWPSLSAAFSAGEGIMSEAHAFDPGHLRFIAVLRFIGARTDRVETVERPRSPITK